MKRHPDRSVERLIRQYVTEVVAPATRGSLRNSTVQNVQRDDLSGNPSNIRAGANVDTPASDRQLGDHGLPMAVCVLLKRGNKYLSVSRGADTNSVGMPGGGVDPGETPKQAAVRELYEETGLTLSNHHEVFVDNDGEYETHTFTGVASGNPHQTASGPHGFEGVVAWVSKEKLCSGPFAEYNKKLFAKLGL